MLNGIGTLVTRHEDEVQGSSIAKNMFQKIVSTTIGHPVSLIYPASTLFPSIYYRSSTDGSAIGCLPAALYTEKIGSYGFQSIPLHTRSMLTSSGFATSTDPRFIAYSYDVLTNLSVNHSDTRIVLNRCLTASDDDSGGLGIRAKNDSALLESIDSRQMVCNLSASQNS